MTGPIARPILCFGEVLVRLSTSAGTPLSRAAALDVQVGGAESNVAAMLAQLGHDVEMVTALPTTSLGDLCLRDLRSFGVGTRHLIRAEGRLGLYFFEPSARGGRVIYDREATAFSKHEEYDWKALASTVGWFHLSGINLALGGKPAAVAMTAVSEMKAAGVRVSFDVNHRNALWQRRPDQDFGAVREIASSADVLFASALDLSRLLGRDLPGESDAQRRAAAESAFAAFSAVGMIASTRRAFANGTQQLSARIDTQHGGYETERATLASVIDRIGSGDAFAGAVIDGILSEETPAQCARKGLAAAVAKHGITGDRWIGTSAELGAFDPFQSGDVVR